MLEEAEHEGNSKLFSAAMSIKTLPLKNKQRNRHAGRGCEKGGTRKLYPELFSKVISSDR